MPKIPGSESLGSPNVPRGTRPIITGADTGAGMVGRGMEKVGATIAAIGEEERKQQDALELIKADADLKQGLAETRRAFETDPDYKTFGTRFDEKAAPLADTIGSKISNPNSRAKWLERARGDVMGARESVLGYGRGLEREHKEVEISNVLDGNQARYAAERDPVARQKILSDTIDYVRTAETTGLIRPKRAEDFRDRFVDGTLALDFDERNLTDPESVARDLGVIPGGRRPAKPASTSTGPLPRSYIDEIKKSEGFAAKATWDYKQNSVGYGTRARHAGETIDKAEADRRLNEELSKAASIVDKFAPGLDEGTRAALVSLTFNAGDDWTRSGLGKAIKAGDLEGARKSFLAYNKAGGETLPGLVARRQREAAWFGRKGEVAAPSVTFEGEPSADIDDDGTGLLPSGEIDPGQGSPSSEIYRHLSGRRRQIEINKNRVALSHFYQRRLDSDIARLEEGREEERDASGMTAWEKAQRVMLPNQVQQFRTKRERALMIRDGATPLPGMTEADAREHMRTIGRDPRTGEDRTDIDYATIREARQVVENTWESIQKQRREDPAAAVDHMPGVTNARAAMRTPDQALSIGTTSPDGTTSLPSIISEDQDPAARQAMVRSVIDARLAAQRDVGIAGHRQRTITKAEAERLLDMGDPAKLDSEAQTTQLAAAAHRIDQMFGRELGERVFTDALVLAFNPNADNLRMYRNRVDVFDREQQSSDARAKLLAKQFFGRQITAADVRGLDVQERWLARINQTPDLLPQPGSGFASNRATVGQEYQPPREPTSREVKVLLDAISSRPNGSARWFREFDQRFGAGAAYRALERIQADEQPAP